MGDIRINRKLFTSDLWQHKPFGRGQAWVDLIGLANWKDNMVIIRGDEFSLKRGQLVGSYRFLAKRWGWGAKRVSNLCQTLKRQQRVTLSTQHQTTIITICKYDSYQTPLNYKATVKATVEETVRQQSGNSEATKQRTKEELTRTEKERKDTNYKTFEERCVTDWNNLTIPYPTIPTVKKVSPNRQKCLKKRFCNKDFVENWPKVLEEIPKNSFLLGNGKTGWVIDFDFLIKNDENYLKILEGKYKSHSGRKLTPAQIEAGKSMKRLEERLKNENRDI